MALRASSYSFAEPVVLARYSLSILELVSAVGAAGEGRTDWFIKTFLNAYAGCYRPNGKTARAFGMRETPTKDNFCGTHKARPRRIANPQVLVTHFPQRCRRLCERGEIGHAAAFITWTDFRGRHCLRSSRAGSAEEPVQGHWP